MSSGAQAQLAASQVATEAQAEANRNALDFAKQVFQYEQQIRNPYMNAGNSAVNEEMYLLGLLPNGTTGGRTGGAGGGTAPGTFHGTAGGGRGTGLANGTTPTPFQGVIPNGTTSTPFQGSLPGDIPNGVTTTPFQGTYGDQQPSQLPMVTQGGGTLMQAPDGTIRMVPASLASYFEERGLNRVR